jgi:hypothetical protein
MVSRCWAEASLQNDYALMIEVARHQVAAFWNQVPATDIQSRASLSHILGYSLMTSSDPDVINEGHKCTLGALRLIESIGERSTAEILMGVWPEDCVQGLTSIISTFSLGQLGIQVQEIISWINLTYKTINSEAMMSDNPVYMQTLRALSIGHRKCEVRALAEMSKWCTVTSGLPDEIAETWFDLFGERLEQLEADAKLPSSDDDVLLCVKRGKAELFRERSNRYKEQGKLELALEMIEKASKQSDISFDLRRAELNLKLGRMEEALNALEKSYSLCRIQALKEFVVRNFGEFRDTVPEESMPQFKEVIPKYPHVLWAANSAGFVELSEEEKKTLFDQLETKKGVYCVNCRVELTKIHKCSGCNVATYCGRTCQKEAWKRHKTVCRKAEPKEKPKEIEN